MAIGLMNKGAKTRTYKSQNPKDYRTNHSDFGGVGEKAKETKKKRGRPKKSGPDNPASRWTEGDWNGLPVVYGGLEGVVRHVLALRKAGKAVTRIRILGHKDDPARRELHKLLEKQIPGIKVVSSPYVLDCSWSEVVYCLQSATRIAHKPGPMHYKLQL